MGAQEFTSVAKGKTAEAAFKAARAQAQYDHGHAGYTGTIAEKHNFVVIKVPTGEDPAKFADKLMNEEDERVSDKWGPAGCVDLGGGKWLFFGWASS